MPAQGRRVNAPRLLVTAPINVRWGDMDALGHVNNAAYATYLEEARLRWFGTIAGGWFDADTAPVLAAQSINYRLPIEWPAEIRVELTLERVGTTSLTLGMRIVSRDPPHAFHADGTNVLVWIDRKTGKPTPLPTHIRRAAEQA